MILMDGRFARFDLPTRLLLHPRFFPLAVGLAGLDFGRCDD